MSPRLPRIKARQLVTVIKKLGCELDRQSGSHAVYYWKSDKRRIIVPVHAGKDLKPKLLMGIIKDLGLTVEEFRDLL